MYRATGSPDPDRKTPEPAIGVFIGEGCEDNNTTSNKEVFVDPVLPSAASEEVDGKVMYINCAFVQDPEENTQSPVKSIDIESKNAHPSERTVFSRFLHSLSSKRSSTHVWLKSRRRHIAYAFRTALFLAYNVFLGFAIHKTWQKTTSWCEGVRFLVVLTAIAYACAFSRLLFKRFLLKAMLRWSKPVAQLYGKVCHFLNVGRVMWTICWVVIVVFLVVDTSEDRYRLVSAGGLLLLLFLGFIGSAHPRKVVWRHVQWGVMLQFVMGFLILRWSVGKAIFQCLGDKVKTFLDFADQGSSFVFGYLVSGELKDAPLQNAVFAFKVLPVVIFFSFIVSILFYYGVMQILVMKVGWLLQVTVGTTACESMNAAGNVFLGMTEAPLMIRPYLPVMTKSELHAVMTGGFATIAGSVLAAYINFGVSASHLLSASVMSAPAALAFSKLFYPETEQSVTNAQDIKIEKPKEMNALEAATNGASVAIALVANIAVNLVAFVAFIGLLDAILSWFGSLIECPFISFEWLLSKIFIPLSLIMGVNLEDSEKIAQLIGLKTIVNEFVAYKKLAEFQEKKLLSARSEAIATFALCGFSNISSIGIQIGALGTMAPDRRSDLASIAIRAMIAGSAACFMTACVAGTLITSEELLTENE